MESQAQLQKFRVLRVESEESWEFFLSQAKDQSCPVVVHFTASWCAPSIAMKHFFEELALNFQDILFLLVDVDEVKGVASKMEVKAMPTFIFFNGANQVDKIVGANPDEIKRRVASFAQSFRAHS
ncbi:thioredoxin-like protein CXXS1 [Nymphaea colorata]|nr:thioredoxin-like protein CXXS1 [Nymphaea colorata]